MKNGVNVILLEYESSKSRVLSCEEKDGQKESPTSAKDSFPKEEIKKIPVPSLEQLNITYATKRLECHHLIWENHKKRM